MGSSISEYFYTPEPAIPPVTDVDKAQAELLVTRDHIRTYELRLTSAIEHTKSAIRDCLKRNRRDLAVLALRKQKFLERCLQSSEDQLAQIELLTVNIDQVQLNARVFEALRQGTDFLQKVNSQLTLDDAEKLMEDTQEAHDYLARINATLSQEGVEADEAELLGQLDQLDAVELPEVPTAQLAENRKARTVLLS